MTSSARNEVRNEEISSIFLSKILNKCAVRKCIIWFNLFNNAAIFCSIGISSGGREESGKTKNS